MRSYTQLTREQRYQIHALMKAEHNQVEIATILGVNKSTIYRELNRNTGCRGYRPKQAHETCLQRRIHKVKPRILKSTWKKIKRMIRKDWSPEQVSARLKIDFNLLVSTEWIYQYIYKNKLNGGSLHQHLRCKKMRRKRYGSYSRRGQIPHRVSIDERPAIVDTRSRFGDWELDTVIGKNHKQALVTIVERKSRLSVSMKVIRKTSMCVTHAIIELLTPFKDWVDTLTADNGREFSGHVEIAKALDSEFYFAHPFSSWERGLNENTNGLIRQYFPKRCDFTVITQQQVQMVVDKLNNRPRKCLGFKTPNEVFFGIEPSVALTD
ncbi:Mobile element protein [hydrothermal vent metagenome]|uniref:Mobile element protein n=1 Tax=hydrothermal vent metagenome TaxID=652676 RepID=A0A3B0Y944_9ZZZZ